MNKEKTVEALIDYILKSPLNIESIPDELERELYMNLYHILDEHMGASCFARVVDWFKSWYKKKEN